MDKVNQLKRSCNLLMVAFPILSLFMFVFSIKQTMAGGCPIVFDLNNNRKIDIIGHTSTREKLYTLFSIGKYVEFDIFANGTLTKIDWIKPSTDGLLIDLRNGIPKGNLTGTHLFGNVGFNSGDGTIFQNGFEKLATLDKNGDGKISDKELLGLALWVDNGDAVFDETEVEYLSDHQIKSIPTSFTPEIGAYGAPKMSSFATTEGSNTIYIEDIWFMTPQDASESDQLFGTFLARFRS